MSDINVIAHGINPETGEYLSKSDRKALFKKGRMGSKIDPSVFKSGVVSGVQAAQKVRQKAESDVGDFAQQERDLDAAAAGGGGSSRGAIVPIQKLTTPNEDIGKVNVEDSGSKENNVEENNVEESKESFKDALKKLLETLQRITRLKSKQGKSGKKTDKLKSKKRKTKKKERKTPGRDIFGIGRKIKGKVTNMFGDIFGIFGDIIAFAALGWITDPKNKKAVKGIITFMGHAFKFINFFVGRFIDNTLTGLAQLLGPDRSIGERFSGALKLIGSFFMYKWIRFPWTIIKDVKKLTGIFKKFGKFVNKIFGKPVKMIQNFVQKSLNKTLGKVFMSNLFKPFRRFIIQVGGKSLYKLLGAVGRGFTKVLSRIPFIGALLEFFLDVFIFKKPLRRSAFKMIGTALIASIGTAIGGPFGTFVGGWIGGELGGKLYDVWFGSGTPDDPEEDSSEANNSPDSPSSSQVSSTGTGSSTSDGVIGALLDTIAFAEGTARMPNSGYNTHFGFSQTADLSKHPDKVITSASGKYSSTAFGRYQFLSTTWASVGGGAMTPARQDWGATRLILKRLGLPQNQAGSDQLKTLLQTNGLTGEISAKLSPEWASFPTLSGRSYYGQPVKSLKSMQAAYNKSLGQGGGTGMVRRTPDKSIAKMTRNPVESAKMTRTPVESAIMTRNPVDNFLMPSMSANFTMEENIRINSGSWSQPIIIDYKEINNARMETNAVTPNNLNTDEESRNPVLRRL